MLDLPAYETQSQVIDTGLNLDFDNLQSTPTFDTYSLKSTPVSTPVLDIVLDLANLQSTPFSISSYQESLPQPMPQLTTNGSTFGEYKTTTKVGGVESMYTPSIEATPILPPPVT